MKTEHKESWTASVHVNVPEGIWVEVPTNMNYRMNERMCISYTSKVSLDDAVQHVHAFVRSISKAAGEQDA